MRHRNAAHWHSTKMSTPLQATDGLLTPTDAPSRGAPLPRMAPALFTKTEITCGTSTFPCDKRSPDTKGFDGMQYHASQETTARVRSAPHLVSFQQLGGELVNSLSIRQIGRINLHVRGAVCPASLSNLQPVPISAGDDYLTAWQRWPHAHHKRTSSSCALVRATSASDAPSLLKAAAMASPMPRPAPVITHLHDAHRLGMRSVVCAQVSGFCTVGVGPSRGRTDVRSEQDADIDLHA